MGEGMEDAGLGGMVMGGVVRGGGGVLGSMEEEGWIWGYWERNRGFGRHSDPMAMRELKVGPRQISTTNRYRHLTVGSALVMERHDFRRK